MWNDNKIQDPSLKIEPLNYGHHSIQDKHLVATIMAMKDGRIESQLNVYMILFLQ
jgi:hypothetical protein